MALRVDEAATGFDEAYWNEDTAAQSVLLIDEATQAITEALHRVRSGSMLDERDVAAAGVALGDLFGGLGQLAALFPPRWSRLPKAVHGKSGHWRTGCRHCAGWPCAPRRPPRRRSWTVPATPPTNGTATI